MRRLLLLALLLAASPVSAQPGADDGRWTLAGLGLLLIVGLVASAALLLHLHQETRRRAQAELLASMAANFPGALFRRRIWPDGRIDYDFLSGSAPSLFGAMPGEWRGAASMAELAERVLPEDRPAWRAAIERSARELSPLDVECRVRGHDGAIRWLRTLAQAWRDGEAVVFDGVVFDVTDRKVAEERLREAERRLADVAANFPGAIYRRRRSPDGELRYLFVSEGIEAVTGASAETFLAMRSVDDMRRVYLPEDAHLWAEATEASARTLEPMDLEGRVRLGDGSIRWIRSFSRARREPDGAVVWDGVVLDVTEAKRLEAALRESEARFRELADAMPQIVWVRDVQGAVTYFNRRWREYTGLSDEEALGWRWLDAVHPDDRERGLAAWRRSIESKQPYEAEVRYRGADGAFRWFLVRAAPIVQDGAVVRWYGAATDIEELKRAERRQRLLMAELDHRVKNTLAAVQSIAARTFAESDEARRFTGRLGALANTHNLIAHGGWEGADLRDIVAAELEPYRGDGAGRAKLEGPQVVLQPRAAQTLGLALHELATNAAKYGALSVSGGRVEVSWRIVANGAGRKLVLNWRERGGPPVSPPTRRGFGLDLIERSVAYEIDGEAAIAFAPEGLSCTLEIAEAAIAQTAAALKPSADGPSAAPG